MSIYVHIHLFADVFVCVYIYIYIHMCVSRHGVQINMDLHQGSAIGPYGLLCQVFPVRKRRGSSQVTTWVVVKTIIPFWGPLDTRCRVMLRTQKGTSILTTTHIASGWVGTVAITLGPEIAPSRTYLTQRLHVALWYIHGP